MQNNCGGGLLAVDSHTGPWCHGGRGEPGPAPSRSHGPRSLLAGRFANIYSYIDLTIYILWGAGRPGQGERERRVGERGGERRVHRNY